MDAPPPQEDVRPFVRIGRHLLGDEAQRAGDLRRATQTNGFLLLEDLGDDTFARVLAAGGDEAELYARATDVLVAVHAAPDHGLLPDLGGYEGEALIDAAMLIAGMVPARSERPRDDGGADRRAIAPPGVPASPPCRRAPARCCCATTTRTICSGCRSGRACAPAACSTSRTRSAAIPSYDLVSLIEDARRDVSPAVRAACTERYLAATGLDAKDFRTGFALMAAQRHARIIGLFVRLLRRDGKPEYLPHLPRVWRMFERSLEHPALEPLRVWVDRHLPPPLRRIGAR